MREEPIIEKNLEIYAQESSSWPQELHCLAVVCRHSVKELNFLNHRPFEHFKIESGTLHVGNGSFEVKGSTHLRAKSILMIALL